MHSVEKFTYFRTIILTLDLAFVVFEILKAAWSIVFFSLFLTRSSAFCFRPLLSNRKCETRLHFRSMWQIVTRSETLNYGADCCCPFLFLSLSHSLPLHTSRLEILANYECIQGKNCRRFFSQHPKSAKGFQLFHRFSGGFLVCYQTCNPVSFKKHPRAGCDSRCLSFTTVGKGNLRRLGGLNEQLCLELLPSLVLIFAFHTLIHSPIACSFQHSFTFKNAQHCLNESTCFFSSHHTPPKRRFFLIFKT